VIGALLFDFDGVIADSMELHFRAWQQVLPPHGVEPEVIVLKTHEGEPAWRIATEFFKRAGRPLDEETARCLADDKNEWFRSQPPPPTFRELPAILDWARAREIRAAVVTGTVRKNVEHVMTGLLLRFDAVIGDGDYPRGKPFPDPYLAAARHFGLAPDACIVIENAPMGIRAAKAAGMFCVALQTTLTPEYLYQADLIMPDHAALMKWLKESEEKGAAPTRTAAPKIA
jgi:beta-phosphoglucomutase